MAMMTPLRRRLAALAVVLLVPTVGGCGISGFAGAEYQTDEVYQPGVGVNDRSGTVDVLGAVVVSATEGSGTFVASLVNNDLEEPDSLTELTGEGLQAEVTDQLQVEPDALLNLSQTGAVEVTGEDIAPGKFVDVTLTFESGQETTMNVPVVRDEEEFAEVKLAGPSESPSPSPGESESPGAEESAAPGAEESGSPAPGDSETAGPNESES
jgi:hypothetical protein